jgi:hypothetical protein
MFWEGNLTVLPLSPSPPWRALLHIVPVRSELTL